MRIAFISDFHLGFGYNTELEEDAFEAANEAIENSLKNADLIVICGDIFDSRAPRTQIFAKTMKILSKAILEGSSNVKLVYADKEIPKICSRVLNSIPIIAIHGNHERKARGEINPVQALEIAGLLIYLDRNTLIFEKNGKKVAIHAMGNVPERYAKSYLEKWSPKPVEGCINILVLHQNIYPYVYSPLEPPTLDIKNLPKGFDLIVNGHIHQTSIEKIENSLLLNVGSTNVIQLEKNEAESKKGFYLFDTDTKKLQFFELRSVRKFFYDEIKICKGKLFREQIEKKIESLISKDFEKKPIIKLRIIGKETDIIEQEIKEIEKKYAKKAILFLTKELESEEIEKKVEFLQNVFDQKKSVEEMGLSLLKKNLDELKFDLEIDFEKLFRLLEEGSEKPFQILLGEQLTLDWLREWLKRLS